MVYYEQQEAHAQACESELLQLAEMFSLNVIMLPVGEYNLLHEDDLENMQVVMLLTSTLLNKALAQSASPLRDSILALYESGRTIVVPIMITTHNHEGTAFGQLQVLPREKKGFSASDFGRW